MGALKISPLLFRRVIIYMMSCFSIAAQVPYLPTLEEQNRPFGKHDIQAFASPSNVYYPETWFHYIGGNVSMEGITCDLEAITASGISGIQLFHGQFGGPWPGVDTQITSLSSTWDEAVRHTAEECRRLGLRFTMLNCSGWATSGGPWIEPANAMRQLVWSRTDLSGDKAISQNLSIPQPSEEVWRDYKDIAVLAFPTPLDHTDKPLVPAAIKRNHDSNWEDYLAGKAKEPIRFQPTTLSNPHWIEVEFQQATVLRAVEFSSINWFNHPQCYEPGVTVRIDAILPDGTVKEILTTEMPQANSQDNKPFTLACSDVYGVNKYRISICNKYNMALSSLRLFSGARKNNWESEAGWTLRSIERNGAFPVQDEKAFVAVDQIHDLTSYMDNEGRLSWTAPAGEWTILRIGHVNTGQKNSPAPPEGTGFECNKLSPAGAEAQFEGYIGRLIHNNGVLSGRLLDGVLIDSWECYTQTWTDGMENEFERVTGYPLRKWLPAIFGYVIKDHEVTTRFLHDWRATINDLYTTNFYGRMTELAHENGLQMMYETAAGDVFPADIMEYYKFADIPMCEFWQPMTDNFVGSSNFKPIRPAASAARLYGKQRLAAEAFTSFDLTFDEHLSMLKEVANVNMADGVTHPVFHTYTHNPQTPFLPPGSSFGAGIGTPFLRGQTWWQHMPEFNTYLARCTYMLERGKPVSDVLWYLGDEINHKPDQNAAFPAGYKYDYCNPDVLLNRLSVKDGKLVTPEGISYRLLWLPDVPRMQPETLEKIYELLQAGATVVGNAPEALVTLVGGTTAQARFDAAVKKIWEEANRQGIHKVGLGYVVSNMDIAEALPALNIPPDVTGGNALWLHRQTEDADWYFVSAPKGSGFNGTLDFRSNGYVEIWNPVTGIACPVTTQSNGDRTLVPIDLAQAASCIVVFYHTASQQPETTACTQPTHTSSLPLTTPWTIAFPAGWGAPESICIPELIPWKELDIPAEGKAFSGTATYTTTFTIASKEAGTTFVLDLGEVEMIASVAVNGIPLRTVWAKPYEVEITDAIKSGENILTLEVTSTWFNRLVYDAGQNPKERKTWTINGPSKDASLRKSGLLGPVRIQISK